MLVFVIPIRHPDDVRDKSRQLECLAQTVASIDAQNSRNFKVVIVANKGQSLPDLPPSFAVQWVDLPPNTNLAQATEREAVYASIRQDKGQRVAAALPHAGPQDAIMVVDDDDLISRRLVAFYESADQTKGYIIDKGYFWESGSDSLTEAAEFHTVCGTSLIIPKSYFARISAPDVAADVQIAELGSHKLIFERHPATTDFARVPFKGAIYRLGHRNASQFDVRKAVRSTADAKTILKQLLKNGNYARIWKKVKKVLGLGKGRTTPLNAQLKAEFFGAQH